MDINGITISQKKSMQLASILPVDVLQDEYEVAGLSDIEIASKYNLSQSYKTPFRYRNKDNQQPSLEGNLLEGSTTEESLTPFFGHGDNSCLGGVTRLGMPDTQIRF